jgi:hypothetical protein
MNQTIEILSKEQAQIVLCEKVLNNPWIEKRFENRILQLVKENKSWDYIRFYIDESIEILKELKYDYETIEVYNEILDLVLYIIDELDE